jgi:hypothetical protein
LSYETVPIHIDALETGEFPVAEMIRLPLNTPATLVLRRDGKSDMRAHVLVTGS